MKNQISDIHWQPQPGKQTIALQRTEKEILLGGARFGGKSEAGRGWLLRPFLDFPQDAHLYRALVLRENAKDLRGWVDKAEAFYAPLRPRIGGNPPVIKFDCGAKFYIGHLADENSYRHYLSDEFQRILIEELTLFKSEQMYLKVLGSCRTTNSIFPQVFNTTNPGNAGHFWVAKRWGIKGKPPYPIKPILLGEFSKGVFIHATIQDNPLGRASDPSYEDYLNSLSEPLRSAWRDGDWSVFAGQFFDLNRHIHGIDAFEIPGNWDVWGSIDYGTANPTSFGIYSKDEITEQIYRIGEYYSPGSADSHAFEIYNLIQRCQWTNIRPEKIEIKAPADLWTKKKLDESRIQSPADVFKAYNLKLRRISSDRINGWRLCKDYLKYEVDNDGKLILSPRFKYFRSECPNFEELIPVQVHSERNVEDLKKCDVDHIADEFRGALVGAERPKFKAHKRLTVRGV